MATSDRQTSCTTCQMEKNTYKCSGCEQNFCLDDLSEHRQQINRLLDEFENERNIFRQTLNEQLENPQNQTFIQQINQWKLESIYKIQ